MDHAVLVDIDVHLGAEIVAALDAERVGFNVAIWATFADYYSPRLVFAATWLDEFRPLVQYEKFADALRGKVSTYRLPPIHLMKMTDPFIEDLRSTLGHLDRIEGMRLDGRSFGGRFLEDGYVYRVR